jgi:hypothetical protein
MDRVYTGGSWVHGIGIHLGSFNSRSTIQILWSKRVFTNLISATRARSDGGGSVSAGGGAGARTRRRLHWWAELANHSSYGGSGVRGTHQGAPRWWWSLRDGARRWLATFPTPGWWVAAPSGHCWPKGLRRGRWLPLNLLDAFNCKGISRNLSSIAC